MWTQFMIRCKSRQEFNFHILVLSEGWLCCVKRIAEMNHNMLGMLDHIYKIKLESSLDALSIRLGWVYERNLDHYIFLHPFLRELNSVVDLIIKGGSYWLIAFKLVTQGSDSGSLCFVHQLQELRDDQMFKWEGGKHQEWWIPFLCLTSVWWRWTIRDDESKNLISDDDQGLFRGRGHRTLIGIPLD